MSLAMPCADSRPSIPPVFEKRFRSVVGAFGRMEGVCGSSAAPVPWPVLPWDVSKIRQTIVSTLETIQDLHDRFQHLSMWLRNECHSPAKRQGELALLTTLRGVQRLLSDMEVSEFVNIVTPNQIDGIARLIGLYAQTGALYEAYLAEQEHFPLEGSFLYTSVQGRELAVPIRVYVEDDDTGKHASCLEIPQVYGFGETEGEALSMLDREILSLYDDIREDVPLSEEYSLLRQQLDELFNDEK